MLREWTRRDFLASGALGAWGLSAIGGARGRPRRPAGLAIDPGTLSKFTQRLAIPPQVDLRHGRPAQLVMRRGLHEFHSALGHTPTFGYGGQGYLGPTLIARRGVPSFLLAVNRLRDHPLADVIDPRVPGTRPGDGAAPPASMHLHGGKTPPPFDGHPLDWFAPGASHRYHYPNAQEAANLWYHDHAEAMTRLNVYAGLAGVYLLRDDWDTGEARNGPGLPFGAHEVPLVLQDKSFQTGRSGSALFYPRRDPAEAAALPPGSPTIWVPEFFGDVAVVNGSVWPVLDVSRSVYRFRLYNAAQSRFYRLFFAAGGPDIWQIGTDQGLLNEPVLLSDGLLVAPAERADLLIDFTRAAPGAEWVLRNDAPAPYPAGSPATLTEIMKFRVGSARGPFHRIPHRLRAEPIRPLRVTGVTRNTTLQERLTVQGYSYGALLDGVPFDTPDRNIIHARRGAVELWNIVNLTGDAHPVHLHLVAFQIRERVPFAPGGQDAYISRWGVNPDSPSPILGYGVGADHSPDPYLDQRSATAPTPGERGWKDTVLCPPGQVTRIAVPFTGIPFPTDRPYRTQRGTAVRGYVWHCHILEHEDFDMMQRYRVL